MAEYENHTQKSAEVQEEIKDINEETEAAPEEKKAKKNVTYNEKGEIIKKVKEEDLFEELRCEIEKMRGR